MTTENPELQKVIQAQTAAVKPAMRKAFDKIVLAGMKLMYSPQMEEHFITQATSGPPAQAAGQGAAKLVGLMLSKSKGTAPFAAMVPAGIVLLCECLDAMEKAGKAQVTPDLVAEAVKEFGSALLQMLGVTPQKLDQIMAGAPKQEQPSQQDAAAQQPAQQPPAQPNPRALIGAPA